MRDIDKVIQTIIDKFEETRMESLVIFHTGLIFIALVVDKLLTYTFPAWTMIAMIMLLTSTALKLYERYRIKKNKFFKD